jgi:hypothetical protein
MRLWSCTCTIGLVNVINNAYNRRMHGALRLIEMQCIHRICTLKTFCVLQPYLLLPDDTDLLAMAFEWVGMDLYYMLRDQHSNVRIMRDSTVNRDMPTRVGSILQDQVSPAAKIKMVVDPFGG